MVSYIRGPAYKSIASFAGVSIPTAKKYLPNLVLWGGAAGAAVATFTEGVPLFQNTFYKKIPYFGQHWEYNPDPEDIPI
ncbi:ubiquinol-cytochrome c reductase core subunit 10 qcr10 [Yamadazyma tenuis]|uniref:Uncharacterized protein n=1 Tax=Candida tenuis (strain ATCC 10573 / BCRC 21748 / CBS 615 / JCM 9827 / NBRC 10315 / NRRL Y-1498 / VKM Y-70) TaxID=590646 RepID=G3B639_CANTC|nr:uncharacterized protein CANTEDRAFT_114685 [Yamadazyma tenuis ATCC 10573]XP_006687166.1 uncharacterized protein CANTEDRAFT_114685 [Yamadazyma tenuis ATCC 10573]EGV63372.1 hypothetical protein CANTEDRAFT_114685 [Yamadazyma tenuis ATCC 10573]EGV63373.1 hypothetical protein CANTEDRAFT_114685 [Yamadazyma tenuis ATCC 10573]WEJ96801.1 ubiquinol-cytochrome c reductase core subunit 10 qcr10 [Yamadazyma tenuis]